ncbi:MAG: excinuclease ABC subunit UvrA [Candidatus Omnitrophica bacterium]|nr:excinuclease ABC subunit UvrA [Candidatus Omnitrophota bacterium]
MDAIILQGVKTHNLKNFDLILNHRKLYVVTGVSGSGKSSLAFDTLYAEGQRRYVESLSAYARQFLERMEKPDVGFVAGIPPAIALEAKNVVTNARSTVGTQTEINDYLRVFFSRIGRTFCPDCGTEVQANHPESVANLLSKSYENQEVLILFSVSIGREGKRYLKDFLSELERQGFTEFYFENKIINAENLVTSLRGELSSPNVLIGDPSSDSRQPHKGAVSPKRAGMTGQGNEILVSADRLIISQKNKKRLTDSLELAFRYGHGKIQTAAGGKQLQFSEGLSCFSCGRTFREPLPNMFSFNSPLGACPECQGFGRVITLDWDLVIPDKNRSLAGGVIEPWTKPGSAWEFKHLLKFCEGKRIPLHKPWKDLSEDQREMVLFGVEGDDYFSVQDFFKHLEKKTYKMHVRIFLAKYRQFVPCTVCGETRLKAEALWVKIAGKNIYDYQSMTIDQLHDFLEHIQFAEGERERVEPVYLEMQRRVRFLKEVGLGYLSLARLSRTLSGGEIQRINLASSLGSALVDTLYVLDEPSIGLHERDNDLLIRLLKELRDLGNTVVVVEHDRSMIEAADEVIDLGPLGGERGGEIIFQGPIADLRQSLESLTGQYLSGRLEVKRRPAQAMKKKGAIFIRGAAEHNLKNIDVEIPLGELVAITGVSGSGKSTLLYEIVYHHFLRAKGRPVQDLGKVKSISGFETIDDVVLVDQSPMGRTPRSNPVTYLKAFDEIRKIFARTREAKRQGFGPGHFSFNVDGGRCPVCKGDGRIKVEMHFLADVYVPCEECQGKRFKPEILDIDYEGKNLDDVLKLTVSEAAQFFAAYETLRDKLLLLERVGLGYLALGQSAMTLSGGESQRIKLAWEISERRARHLLYLFDEPTTGLHYHDIHYLMEVFEELLSRGHSLVVIEHNMEVIRSADTIIDLGPEGGEGGGQVVYAGPREGILKCPNSYTGKYLAKYLKKPGQSCRV